LADDPGGYFLDSAVTCPKQWLWMI